MRTDWMDTRRERRRKEQRRERDLGYRYRWFRRGMPPQRETILGSGGIRLSAPDRRRADRRGASNG